jgi:guanylate kinase
MLVLSSPSGAGKSTLTRQLRQDYPEIVLSVSVTTRARRGSEIDGTHYHFISEQRFHQMRERDDLLEWAKVHDNYYGTPRSAVEEALAAGRDVLFDIDWQGAEQVAEKMPQDVVRIFILPPSAQELAQRLQRRAEDTPDVIRRRLANARVEIAQWERYDYVIINDDLARAYVTLQGILAAERAKPSRWSALAGFVGTLDADLDALTKD